MTLVLLPKGPFAGTWVFASCEQTAVGYRCFTHELDFPHRQALAKHVDATPDAEHEIARFCPRHLVHEAIPRKEEAA